MKQRTIWFKARRYGWGWTPASWQGWLATVVYVILIVLLAFLLLPHTSNGSFSTVNFVTFILFTISLTFILVGLCFGWGEKPGWRWGSKKEKDNATD